MPPRDPKPAISRRKSKANLDMPEPELAEMLHQYCDLRRRGFDQAAIQTKSSWPKSHQKLLLKEAQRRAHAWLPEKPGTGHDRMAAGHVRRRYRTQDHPKGVGPFEPADQEAAGSRPRRRQRTSPQRPHHQKPRWNASQGFLLAVTEHLRTGRLTAPSRPTTPPNSPYGSAPRSPKGW